MTIDPSRLKEWLSVPVEELERRARVPFTLTSSREELHRQFAEEMFTEAAEAAEVGRPLAVIVPVGPMGQYPVLADMINESRLSLEHMTFFGMDQMLDWQGRPLALDHPFNFEGLFHRRFLELLDPVLRPPREQVVFPSPFDLDGPARRMEELGGVATTYGGVGFQGHIAFNEPPDVRWSPVGLDEFRACRTRVLSLTLDTLIAQGQRNLGGNAAAVPPMAVTLGMRELLAATRVRLYLDTGAWKQTILRILLFSDPDVAYPATLVHGHPDVRVTAGLETATCPAQPW